MCINSIPCKTKPVGFQMCNYILSEKFPAFVCFEKCKSGDMNKLELNVLYGKYISLVAMESDHSCLWSSSKPHSSATKFKIGSINCVHRMVWRRKKMYPVPFHVLTSPLIHMENRTGLHTSPCFRPLGHIKRIRRVSTCLHFSLKYTVHIGDWRNYFAVHSFLSQDFP